MKVKVCGITQHAQLRALEELGVDYAGLIFYPGSKRFVGKQLSGADAEAVSIKKIGVFVNEEISKMISLIQEYHLYAVQLHGGEDATTCADLQPHAVVIKALAVQPDANLDALAEPYANAVNYFLFDTASAAGSGGTGNRWDWALLKTYSLQKPFFLSGGIALQDAAAIKKITHPMLYAVDINSRFETTPGVKNLERVQAFIKELNS